MYGMVSAYGSIHFSYKIYCYILQATNAAVSEYFKVMFLF